jgi:hypothetical protein
VPFVIFRETVTASIYCSFLATDEAHILVDVIDENATEMQAPRAVPIGTLGRPEDCPRTLCRSGRERRIPSDGIYDDLPC